METVNPFLARVHDALHELGRSRTWLAKETGINYKTINSWYLHNRYPTVEHARLIARALDVSLDWLATGEDSSRRHEHPIIVEVIEYMEGLSEPDLLQVFGMVKFAKAISLSESVTFGKQERA